jgi:hypothetical protein
MVRSEDVAGASAESFEAGYSVCGSTAVMFSHTDISVVHDAVLKADASGELSGGAHEGQ